MNKEQSRVKMSSLMALMLFAVFAVCVLLVLLTGADVYKNLVERDEKSFDGRTAVSYLTTKVRQADRLGAVEVSVLGGAAEENSGQENGKIEALKLSEEIEGETYITWIYCYDGYLRELFAAEDTILPPDAGEKVLKAEALSVQWRDGCLSVAVTAVDGTSQSLILGLRSGKEVSP